PRGGGGVAEHDGSASAAPWGAPRHGARARVYWVGRGAGAGRTARGGPPEGGLRRRSQFHECIRHEVLPAIHADLGHQALDVVASGASIGAFNAVAVLCRYPDVFSAAVGLSGTYRIERFYDHAWSQDLYYSAPLQFLPGLDGPPLERLRQRRGVVAARPGGPGGLPGRRPTPPP